jgi:hypothetical protein
MAILIDAKQRLEAKIRLGKDLQDELVAVIAKTVIRDKLASPASISFLIDDGQLNILYAKGVSEQATIHRHALGQLAAKVELPMIYVNKLAFGEEWRKDLLATNLNELYGNIAFVDRQGNPARFLHRLVGNQLRGFLSRNYNRHLASAPLLRAFLSACGEVQAAPVEATMSDVKVGLKCFLPTVFEPAPNEFVAIGTSWSNSDFGSGRATVALTSMRITSGTTAILDDDAFSRTHLGSIIKESDIEMSEELAAKEAEAHCMAIRETVLKQLEPEAVEKLLSAITAAYQEEIPWHKLRGQLARFLQKEELSALDAVLAVGADDIIDLPPIGRTGQGEALPTKWWASAAVSWTANKTQDVDRRSDLQQFAGSFLVT